MEQNTHYPHHVHCDDATDSDLLLAKLLKFCPYVSNIDECDIGREEADFADKERDDEVVMAILAQTILCENTYNMVNYRSGDNGSRKRLIDILRSWNPPELKTGEFSVVLRLNKSRGNNSRSILLHWLWCEN